MIPSSLSVPGVGAVAPAAVSGAPVTSGTWVGKGGRGRAGGGTKTCGFGLRNKQEELPAESATTNAMSRRFTMLYP